MSEEKENEFGGVAIVYEDEILLCLRSPRMEHFPSHWSIPSGFERLIIVHHISNSTSYC